MRGAAALDAGDQFRGGARSGSSESSNLGPPGVKTTGAWVRKELRGMRDSPGPKAGHERVCGGASSDGGGSARRGSPAQAVRGSPVFRKGRKRPVERVQCMGNKKGGS
jgi:hypothetical protein